MFVTLESLDGYKFILPLSAAQKSATLRAMLESPVFAESQTKHVRLENIRGEILEQVCCYLMYADKWKNEKTANIPEFYVAPEMAIELATASDYLEL